MQGHLASRADSGDKTEKRERVGRRHGAVHVLVHELGAVEGVEVADLEPLCRRSLTRGCGLGGNRLLFRKPVARDLAAGLVITDPIGEVLSQL